MDRAAWLWGAGAAVCGVLLCLLHPWRAQFRTSRQAMLANRWLWIVPAAALAAEMLWQWRVPEAAPPDLPLVYRAAVAACGSVVSLLTWLQHGEFFTMVVAAAFLANSAGLRRGLCTGIVGIFSGGWRWVMYLVLYGSAVASLGAPMVRYGAGGETGRWIVKLMSAPWTATAATLLMCWLWLVFETASRKSGKSKIRWVEMTGQYTARLWPLAVLGSIAIPLAEWLNPETLAILRWYAWPMALLLAWFPFTALRSTEAGEIHTVCRVALQRWGSGVLLFLGWVSVAGVWLLAFHLLREWLVSLCPPQTWYRALLSGVLQTVLALPAVWLLGAWVGMQVDKLPAPGKQRRSHS